MNRFKGKTTFVASGTETMSPYMYRQLARALDASVEYNIEQQIDFIVVGANTSKLAIDRAESNGAKVVSEASFMRLFEKEMYGQGWSPMSLSEAILDVSLGPPKEWTFRVKVSGVSIPKSMLGTTAELRTSICSSLVARFIPSRIRCWIENTDFENQEKIFTSAATDVVLSEFSVQENMPSTVDLSFSFPVPVSEELQYLDEEGIAEWCLHYGGGKAACDTMWSLDGAIEPLRFEKIDCAPTPSTIWLS